MKSFSTVRDLILRNLPMALSVTSVFVGVPLGEILKTYVLLSDINIIFISLPGIILVQLLQTVMLPLLWARVITGITSLKDGVSRKVTVRTVTYIASTTATAVTLGLMMVLLVQPGADVKVGESVDDDDDGVDFPHLHTFLELFENMLQENFIEACYQMIKGHWVKVPVELKGNSTFSSESELQNVIQLITSPNMLCQIIVCGSVGLALRTIAPKGRLIVDICVAMNEACMIAVECILVYMPVGVLSMTVSHVIEVGESWSTVLKVGKFIGLVLCGLAFFGGILLPMIYLVFVKKNPFHFIRGLTPALVKTMVISHRSAIDLITKCCEEVNGVDNRITGFVLPIGMNNNMNGTALYEAAAIVFIMQLANVTMNWTQLITAALTVPVSTAGDAGIPTTGPMTTLFILAVVGLPAREVYILFAIKWLLNRCSSVINVLSDCIGAAVVAQLSSKELNEVDKQTQNRTEAAAEDHTAQHT